MDGFRFQYSIWSLLVLTTLTAVVLALGEWIGWEPAAALVCWLFVVGLFALALARWDPRAVLVGLVAAMVLPAIVAAGLLDDYSSYFVGMMLVVLCVEGIHHGTLARRLRRRGTQRRGTQGDSANIFSSLPLPLPARWMRRTILGVSCGMILVMVAITIGMACWAPARNWNSAFDHWDRQVVTGYTVAEMEDYGMQYPSASSPSWVFRSAVAAFPAVVFAVLSVVAAVGARFATEDRRDRRLWSVGIAHTLCGLFLAFDVLHGFLGLFAFLSPHWAPGHIVNEMIWDAAWLPVGATLLAVSLLVLGRHMGRYLQLCGWLVTVGAAAAVDSVLFVAVTLLLLFC